MKKLQINIETIAKLKTLISQIMMSVAFFLVFFVVLYFESMKLGFHATEKDTEYHKVEYMFIKGGGGKSSRSQIYLHDIDQKKSLSVEWGAWFMDVDTTKPFELKLIKLEYNKVIWVKQDDIEIIDVGDGLRKVNQHLARTQSQLYWAIAILLVLVSIYISLLFIKFDTRNDS